MEYLAIAETFAEEPFLKKLSVAHADLGKLINPDEWEITASSMLPITRRLSCARILGAFRPLMNQIAQEPEEGWLSFVYQTAVNHLYFRPDLTHTPLQQDAALCFLHVLRALFDEERRVLPFDFWLDFDFCTEEELQHSSIAREYRQFMRAFREEYVYELLRLGREVTPFKTLDHIAGVHHVAMKTARAFKRGGGKIDLALMSGAAAGHDIGKYGCLPGERVPYLHYYYSDQWFAQRNLNTIGHIAANHSVWDLEIENLSSESLVLVYSDFRVKQVWKDGSETAQLFSLKDAFDVILSKLDNVDDAKRKRYQYVYAKLHDFEQYLILFGVDTSLETEGTSPLFRQDASLLTAEEVVDAIRYTAVDHNIRLMHRLGRERLFAGILEAARGEKDPARIRAYVSIFEEYFTYWSTRQKEQTLEFLYELLLLPDGDIRRQAAILMGRILALFLSGYKKELPAGIAPSSQEERPFQLWEDYLTRLIHPDYRLTPRQISMIRYQAKTVADALLENCAVSDIPRFAEILFRHYQDPQSVDSEGAFALLDTLLNFPINHIPDMGTVLNFISWWLSHGESVQQAAALRLLRYLQANLPKEDAAQAQIRQVVQNDTYEHNTLLLFLHAHIGYRVGLDTTDLFSKLDQPEAISNVFLDNLKSATPWVFKAVGVEYLLHQANHNEQSNTLHIATHFSNLIKVSENVVVRRMAGAALLSLAPKLTPERRNEIAVELSKALETGQAEISQYIPGYLGQFALWLSPRELDEILDHMLFLLASPNTSVVAAALSTVGFMLEHYTVYSTRFGEDAKVIERRRRKMAGILMKGLASCHESVRQEVLRILGEVLFASKVLTHEEKASLFSLTAKKILFLINEQPEQELTFFYTASALSHIYRFIVSQQIEVGPFTFKTRPKAAFFPGTFDPFSLSHKGIVQAIRDLGFEVYLSVDEFSWSKKAQPSLIRRQIVSMSVADTFDVYLFPHDTPVNLTNTDDLNRLRDVFKDRELYLAVGSDVVANASSYKAAPTPGSVHSLNHIVFRRVSIVEGHEVEADLSSILGDVIQLQLPTHLEDISSTRIRENIDLGRDISNLIDPTVQDYIFRNSLYLREPQYKQLVHAGFLDFSYVEHPDENLLEELRDTMPSLSELDEQDSLFILRDTEKAQLLGILSLRTINSGELYETLGDRELANYVRIRTAGRIRLLTGLHTGVSHNRYDIGQLLLTEALSRALADDCSYAVWWAGPTSSETLDLLERQGFRPAEIETPVPLLLVDMRAPVVLLQNIATTLKEPFASDPQVRKAIHKAHFKFQRALCDMYPGNLVLSLNAEVLYHRLVRKITALNGVPVEPTTPRVLGPKMCVPFGKILRGNAVPNTVTKTIHTDKVFAPDIRSFTIKAYPGYVPLESQIRTVHSFQRPAILVDDLLHSGNRLRSLDPLFRNENLNIDLVLVALLSGRGRDLMASQNRKVDSVYFIPDMQAWYVESTMYPFIGGDTVDGARSSVPGLTPAVNTILPYCFPSFYKQLSRTAVFRFSQVCLQNARDIMLALESTYRELYSRNLTLSRLTEAINLPLAPDKGASLHYEPNQAASTCLDNDLKMLQRMQNLTE
jgi:nicotinic acid mononucleotide adenylyltransferase